MKLLRRQISASDRIPDRFYVISMEFLSLSRRRSSSRNVPSGDDVISARKAKHLDVTTMFTHTLMQTRLSANQSARTILVILQI